MFGLEANISEADVTDNQYQTLITTAKSYSVIAEVNSA